MPPIPRYAPHILDLLRSSPLGLTPGGILDLGQEAGWLLDGGRATYQRILRTLSFLQSRNLVIRSGKRYVLPQERLVARYLAEAEAAVSLRLRSSLLPPDLKAWQGAFVQALEGELLHDARSISTSPAFETGAPIRHQ